MKRKLIHKLLEWKKNSNKLLLLSGAKGVGKTYLIQDFAKGFYSKFIYINFEREPYLYELFSSSDSLKIKEKLINHFNLPQDDTTPTLLILDEVFETKSPILNQLLKLNHSYCNIHIIAITSLLKYDSIFEKDVDNKQIQFLTLYPLDFEEYLLATGNEWYVELIQSHFTSNKKIPEIVHQELLILFDDYLKIGGMPYVVNEYINTESKENIWEIQRMILNSYIANVYRHNGESDAIKIHQAFHTLDQQLTKENKKFLFTLIRKGASKAMYMDALRYISESFYGIFCFKFSKDRNDFNYFYDTNQSFKLYLIDNGLLYSIIQQEKFTLDLDTKYGIIENYVATHLKSKGYDLKFWDTKSKTKVEFVIKQDDKYIPIVIKTDSSTRSRSVSVLKKKFENLTYGDTIKVSQSNFGYSNNIKYVPFYAVFCIGTD